MVICLGRSLRSSRRSIEVGHQTIRLARSNTTASASSKPSDLKKRLIHGHESQVQESWHRLLTALQREREEIKALGSTTVPEINFYHLSDVERRTKLRDALHKRGVAVIRGVVTPKEALDWKELVQRYTRTNPSTKAFPAANPAVYELYWSSSQILARAHPNILKTQKFLMSHWQATPSPKTSSETNTPPLISTSYPVTYADRLRIRQPRDSGFALGPHIDGGSCERWEENGYGLGGVYNSIFAGEWESYDPWEMTCRIPVKSDLYDGPGGCSMYRMFQGWLAMSETGAGEGHLMVCPMLREATAYFLLRPFFEAVNGEGKNDYLDARNWRLEEMVSSVLQGAVPANGQELNAVMHPHLGLEDTMVHVPRVRPGDYVVWHCDTIHAVDKIHNGTSDSSVMYIPACPLTEANAEYLARQRETFAEGTPAPDFPSGEGESHHRGRLTPEYVMKNISLEAQQAMGLAPYDAEQKGIPERERGVLTAANRVLGFSEL
ncbi:MAG: hypothetical protein L6R41_007282 [Letrouitia leprolyta]|nr:MAG: hypothetical protein L6R41_007282 [Letrouitia leprolyta]